MSTPLQNLKTLKNSYIKSFDLLKQKFLEKHDSSNFLKKNANLCDQVIKQIWETSAVGDKFCLVAVGGYGRRELYPASDIDLAIICKNLADLEQEKEKIELFIQHCWDFGFRIGVSQRVEDEIKKDIEDITIATNLLESRYISGNQKIYNNYLIKFKKVLNVKQFILNKISEQDQRHSKYSKSGYLLEPNIKESRGCLRDIHFIRWLCAAQFQSHELQTLCEHHIIDKKQLNLLKFHYNKLIKRRIFLHIVANGQEDRMLFDYQAKIASDLGFKNSPEKKSSEYVMNSLYKSIRYIILLNEIITKKFTLQFHKKPQKIKNYPELFKVNGLIELDPKSKKDISKNIFKYFLLYQKNNELTGFGPNLISKFQYIAEHKINSSFRKNSIIQQDFVAIFSGQQKVNRSLRLLNRYNILGKFLPVFGRIVSQMQHDLFHIYTVDEHTLNVIDNLRRYGKSSLKHEFPESYEAFQRLKHPYILYFAGLFHDIGKGRGGNHSEIGKNEVMKFGKFFNLAPNDTLLVAWLVENHLLMSNVAQKLDLADPSVIRSFADKVTTPERLDLLYLLTTADIRGTSHKVWNQWKSVLINNLHQTTIKYLENRLTNQQMIDQRINQAKSNLMKYSVSFDMYEKNWGLMGPEYFKKFEASEIAWHTRLLLTHSETKKTIVRVRHQKGGQGIEVLIFTRDKSHIFLRACHFFHEISCEISQAKIYTTSHHFALNVFHVTYEDESSLRFKDFFKYIESRLTEIIDSCVSLENIEQNQLKKSRQASFHQIEDHIEIHQNEEGFCHLQVKTSNRVALLLSIANVFKNHQINISNAKITTMGERVEDHFDFKKPHETFSLEKLHSELKKLIA